MQTSHYELVGLITTIASGVPEVAVAVAGSVEMGPFYFVIYYPWAVGLCYGCEVSGDGIVDCGVGRK